MVFYFSFFMVLQFFFCFFFCLAPMVCFLFSPADPSPLVSPLAPIREHLHSSPLSMKPSDHENLCAFQQLLSNVFENRCGDGSTVTSTRFWLVHHNNDHVLRIIGRSKSYK